MGLNEQEQSEGLQKGGEKKHENHGMSQQKVEAFILVGAAGPVWEPSGEL
jgi:hypothetical protein